MRIMYITPHLSTGGMPEYLRRKVELLKEDNDIWVVEKNFEPAYRSIRDKIQSLIGDRLINIGANQHRLIEKIEEVRPDVIHFEELSDYHFSEEVLERIYKKERAYKIFDTLHDSSIDASEKRFIPDKMIVVSAWQMKNFMRLGMPIEIIEHEIVAGTRDRDAGLAKLGLDPNRKHVLQVGLFSRRKNQSETFRLAKAMPDVMFHFVGNQTENYRDYWDILIKEKPENCSIWGERPDTDTFYSCMDCVIFPSRGEYGDRETSPLVIREAIAWQTPLFLRDLPVYMDMYSESEKVKFMSDDIAKNSETLYGFLKMEKQKKQNEKMTDSEFFKKRLFEIKFDEQDNKINFQYLETAPFDARVCVRDMDTEVPIYSFGARFENRNGIWCVPIPKAHYDFKNNPNFGGFLYDFYVDGERVYSATTRIKATSKKKRKFRVESFDPLFINYEQFFTDRIYDRFFDQIEGLATVVDIGANVGQFTELALSKGAKNIISAEVSEEAIRIFKGMHGSNESVRLVDKAISKSNGEIDIYISPENSLIGSAYNTGGNLSQKQTVESITLANLLADTEEVDLLKMDVEGSEYAIFDGADSDTIRKAKHILIEFHDNFGGVLRDSILKRLSENGYQFGIYQEDCINEASEYEEKGTVFAKKN